MLRNLNPSRIVMHQFCPYSHPVGRKFSPSYLMLFCLFPTAIGSALAGTLGPVIPSTIDAFFVVFAVMGALMTAFIAIVHAVVGRITVRSDLDEGQFLLVRTQVRRLEVLRDLYASIAYAVLLQVLAMLPLLVLLFVATWVPRVGDAERTGATVMWEITRYFCSGLVYAIATCVAVSFLNVITGVYEILEMEADDLETDLRNADPAPTKSQSRAPSKSQHKPENAAKRSSISAAIPGP